MHARIITTEQLAVARVGSLAYTTFNLYEDAQLSSLREWIETKMNHDPTTDKDGLSFQVWGLFHPQPSPAISFGLTGKPDTSNMSAGLAAHWIHCSYPVNLFNAVRLVGGLCFVGVDMLHKKRGFAKQVVTHFLHECNTKGHHLAALYPFRSDFYAKMGFGLSSSYHDYVISPASLPSSPSVQASKKARVASYTTLQHLDTSHAAEISACQMRFAKTRHGMFLLPVELIKDTVFEGKAGSKRAIGYRDESSTLRGFISFEFVSTTNGPFINDLKILDLVYETEEAFFALLQFLNEQQDQIRHVLYTTQEPDFFRLLSDPRDAAAIGAQAGLAGFCRVASTETIGLMYRVVNLEKLFSEYFSDRDFNGVDGFKLLIRLQDTFVPELNPPVLLQLTGGRATVIGSGDAVLEREGADDVVALDMDVSDFSSLIVGAVSLNVLLRYGKASVAPVEKKAVVARMFWTEDAPMNSFFF
ncbi:hypothetical protein HDU77_009178 [Chytriomyces hyalinus]|nr:hypothetical protein HDU77_009178 [Chytriomyces hyalinus]